MPVGCQVFLFCQPFNRGFALGQYDQALLDHQQALVIYREVGNRAGEGITLNNIGAVYHDRGQHDQALNYYQQALVIARDVGDRVLEEVVLANMGDERRGWIREFLGWLFRP